MNERKLCNMINSFYLLLRTKVKKKDAFRCELKNANSGEGMGLEGRGQGAERLVSAF